MNFEYNGKKYEINFCYGAPISASMKDKSRQRALGTTMCLITESTDARREDQPVLAMGKSVCSEKDNFVRETARKIALRRALETCGKDFRKVAWTAYFARKTKHVAV